MLALLLIPALLSLALFIDTDDDTETDEDLQQTEDPVDPPEAGVNNTPPQQSGTQGLNSSQDPDRIEGTDAGDNISGRGGNDFLQGFGGNDTIDGGSGNDTLYAGDGDDMAEGGTGNDRVFLGDGDDQYSPIENDIADRGDDLIRGGEGDDGIIDLSGSDTLYGDAGDDILAAFGRGLPDAPDTIDGGAGDDTLFGDNADVMTGGEGEDIFSIIRPVNQSPDPVTIQDFDVRDDTLVLFVPQANTSFESVDLRFDPTANALRAFWRGDEVAILRGLDNADIPDVRISIFDADDLTSGRF